MTIKKVNLEAIKEHVGTQYGDLTGVIQIDGFNNISSIYDLCKDHKFDTSNKFIIGFSLIESTTDGIGKTNIVDCSILFVDKDEYGNTYEEIENKIKLSGNLILKKKNIDIKYSDLGKYIKRYNFIATTELTRYASSIEINEDESEY